MTPEKEKALKDEAAAYSETNYARAFLQSIEDAEYIQAVSMYSFIAGATSEALRNESKMLWN